MYMNYLSPSMAAKLLVIQTVCHPEHEKILLYKCFNKYNFDMILIAL